MKSFRDPKYDERYEDVVFDLETALNTTVANSWLARDVRDFSIFGYPPCWCSTAGEIYI